MLSKIISWLRTGPTADSLFIKISYKQKKRSFISTYVYVTNFMYEGSEILIFSGGSEQNRTEQNRMLKFH
jgi:hypothetical protein